MDQIENNIALCSLCKNIYNTPRMLPCQHTFCESCLTNFIQNHAKMRKKKTPHFQCPSCERRTKLEKNTEGTYNASQFPKSLTMQALLESETVMRKLKKISRKKKNEDKTAKVENANNDPPKGDGALITINSTPLTGVELIIYQIAQDMVNFLNYYPAKFCLILTCIVYVLLCLSVLLILLAYLFPTIIILLLIDEVLHAFTQWKIVKLCPKRWLMNCLVSVLIQFTSYVFMLYGGFLIMESINVLSNRWYSGATHAVSPSVYEYALIRTYTVLNIVNHKLTYDYLKVVLLSLVSFSIIMNMLDIYSNRMQRKYNIGNMTIYIILLICTLVCAYLLKQTA